ncbi:TerB family tellurite resistance protein [Odoribacter lunatus]|uniref:tellurite resistance TerB family protein n=1 Tax=Odoribacter lunatus TaxID=2941335 RepID=UPI00203D6132|nr:TerB family tellurite resistance protein [Odoribacter lunatus]
MTKQELYLKTMFCCMACDGNIATEEIAMIKAIAIQTSLFEELDVENILNTYITAINQNGILFLRSYLNELSEEDLTPNEELVLIDLAIKMIEADNCIEYSEIKFFKKIRSRLSVSDKQILEKHPNKEDFLLPDINVSEVPTWDENIMFATISLS